MKKIFVWSPFIDYVGTTKSTLNSLLSIRKFGNKNFSLTVINVFGEWDKYLDSLEEIGVKFINLNIKKDLPFVKKKGFIFSRLFYLKVFFLSFIPLLRILKIKKPDYLIITLITFLPLVINFLFSLNTKIILRISGFPKLNIIRLYFWKLVLSKVKWIFSPTEITNEILKKKFPYFENKFHFIRDPIFSYKDIYNLKKKKPTYKNKKFYIAAGRLTKQKNFEFLIRAVYEYNKIYRKKINVIVIGDGEDRSKLNNLSHSLKVSNYIKFVGFKKNVYKYFLNAKALICTSLWEDPGFILIEAGIANLPVISNSCKSGPIEIIKNENNGYLYPYNSLKGLVEKLKAFENENEKNILKKVINMKIYTKNFSLFKFYKNFSKYV